MDDKFLNQVGKARISDRQIDELIGIARGIVADDHINQKEVEFLQKWLAVNQDISNQSVINMLYSRVNEILADGIVDEDEKAELLDTLNRFSNRDFELGELLKATTLPLCSPAPTIEFKNSRFCFTGTFTFGKRKACEEAVIKRGATAGILTQSTDYLVIGLYATESWKHSAFGTKITKAAEWREEGIPISIISEEYWQNHL